MSGAHMHTTYFLRVKVLILISIKIMYCGCTLSKVNECKNFYLRTERNKQESLSKLINKKTHTIKNGKIYKECGVPCVPK
jgi:hypothetical protein